MNTAVAGGGPAPAGDPTLSSRREPVKGPGQWVARARVSAARIGSWKAPPPPIAYSP
jgi:hypothetical protein